MVADAPLVHLVRLAAVVSVLALLAQAVSVLAIPAALVGVGGALLGVRRVGRTPSEAQLPLGVTLVASLLAGWLSLLTGVPGLVLAALLATGSAWFGLRTCRELAARRRRTWGVHQLDVLHRQREVDDRRTGWARSPDGPTDADGSGHDGTGGDVTDRDGAGRDGGERDGAGPHGRDPA